MRYRTRRLCFIQSNYKRVGVKTINVFYGSYQLLMRHAKRQNSEVGSFLFSLSQSTSELGTSTESSSEVPNHVSSDGTEDQ